MAVKSENTGSNAEPSSPTRYARLSIATAVLTMALKTVAYFLTGSVGLLSDAVESLVNLVGGIVALSMLTVAAKPADDDHAYGHSKAEYFSSGVEGTLILIAALSIAFAAVQRLIEPKPLEQVGIGLVVSLAASVANLAAAMVILRAGRRHRSITLEANAQHLLTDVWTSVGVLVGVGVVAFTHWNWLDPVVALLVAANIVWTGVRIIQSSVAGLMDAALPPEELRQLDEVLQTHKREGIEFHALRTRQAGARRFVSFHVLVPGDWTVQHGHQLLEQIEEEVRQRLPSTTVFTHLESLDDPRSWEDTKLERPQQPNGSQPAAPAS